MSSDLPHTTSPIEAPIPVAVTGAAANKKFRRVAIKVGSNVLTGADGTLDLNRITHIVSLIAAHHNDGVEVILVSSGAVAAGRSVIPDVREAPVPTPHVAPEEATRQLRAAIGQAKLMHTYYGLFLEKGLIAGQVLTTKEHFFDDVHYFNQKACMEALLANRVIPIVNENDAVAVSELMFTDNDELAGLIAVMMKCDALIILSNIDGIYTGDPSNPESQIIAEATPTEDLAAYIRTDKSSLGRGGMTSKVRIAQETAAKGVCVIITNGTRENAISNVMNDTPGLRSTRFTASQDNMLEPSAASAMEMMGIPGGGVGYSPGPSPLGSADDIAAIAARVAAQQKRASGSPPPPAAAVACIPPPILTECEDTIEANRRIDAAVRAVDSLRVCSAADPNFVASVLNAAADALVARKQEILNANSDDLARMDPKDPKYDRLKLTDARIEGIAGDMRSVATLPSPLGKVLLTIDRPNGSTINKVTVPFGVVGVIYEARPNVTVDVFALCIASGNVCLLKGSSDAAASNECLAGILRGVLAAKGVSPDACTLLPPAREAAMALLHAEGRVDVVIPRGGKGLIAWVRRNARIPSIETGAGVCHAYVSPTADTAMAAAIVTNAKCRRVSVCNALDCMLIHSARLGDLPQLCARLADHNVVVCADERALAALAGSYPAELLQPATEADFGTEFLDFKMSIRTVDSLDEATAHINRFGSRHSECIVAGAGSPEIAQFQSAVDAACVYANVSTAFTDGAQFGFGAEIGISTQKLHARGPMALPELTTYKYLVSGNGQIRN